MTVGIYLIRDPYSGKSLYVGQSKNIEYRWTQHKARLRRGKGIPEFVAYLKSARLNVGLLEFVTLVECENNQQVKNYLECAMFEAYSPLFYGKPPSMNYIAGAENQKSDKWLRKFYCEFCSEPFSSKEDAPRFCNPSCRSLGTRSARTSFVVSCSVCTEIQNTTGSTKFIVCDACAESRKHCKLVSKEEVGTLAKKLVAEGKTIRFASRYMGYSYSFVYNSVNTIS